jgi:hypothetical protein
MPARATDRSRGGEAWNRSPRRLDDWSRFVRALTTAMRRHPNIISYEIYNEENVKQWWNGTAAEYTAALTRAADPIRSVDPTL